MATRRRNTRNSGSRSQSEASAARTSILDDLDLPQPDPIKKNTNQALALTERNWEIVERMAEYLCSVDEIADFLGCSKAHLYNSENSARVKEIIARKGAATKMLLRKRQIEGALSGNGMVERIWLGKQHLGQADKNELTGADGQPLIESGARAVEKLFELMAQAKAAREKAIAGEVVDAEVVDGSSAGQLPSGNPNNDEAQRDADQ